MKHTCIIVAAGKGSRMKSDIPKQYLKLEGHPVLYYTIKAVEDSFINDIILVVPKGDKDYVTKEIVNKYNFQKVTSIVEGESERYLSVYKGLVACESTDYVYIQDGVRPFITADILQRVKWEVEESKAVVAAVPVKDTIKEATEDAVVSKTLDRNVLWAMQTPQAFDYSLIFNAYQLLLKTDQKGITDDACVIEKMTDKKVKLVMGDYGNIKITTPEDLEFAKIVIKTMGNNH